MPRTYDRLETLLREVDKNEKKSTAEKFGDFAETLSTRNLPEFLLDRPNRRYMSSDGIKRLLDLIKDLKLATVTGQAVMRLTAPGRNTLNQADFDPTLETAVLEYLEISLDQLEQAIKSSRPRTAVKILRSLKKTSSLRSELSEERFRMLLYLLSCTGTVDRYVTVAYAARP